MSESLSEDQLAEIIRSGRINTPKSAAAKRRQTKMSGTVNNKPIKAQTSGPRSSDSPRESNLTTSSKELDPEWLKAEKEKVERNIAAKRQDKRIREEMQEASRF